MRCGVALFALAALTAEAPFPVNPPFADSPHALSLKVQEHDGKVEIELSGHAPQATKVSYLLEVSGSSTSRHRGSTTLAADAPVRLSTMRIDAGDAWCVRLLAEEEGRAPYEIVEGNCSDNG